MLFIYLLLFSIIFISAFKNYKNNIFLSLWIIIIVQEIIFAILATQAVGNFVSYIIVLDETYLVNALLTVLLPLIISVVSKKNSQVIVFSNGKASYVKLLIIALSIPFYFSILKLISVHGSFFVIPFTDLRSEIRSNLSGVDFVFLRFGILLCVLLSIQYLKKNSRTNLVLIVLTIYSLSLYGGRFLPFFGILVSVMVIFSESMKNITARKIIPSLLIFHLFSIIAANLRYFYSNSGSLNSVFKSEYLLATSYWQLGGAWVDYSRVAKSVDNMILTEGFFATMFQGFFPGGVRELFFGNYFDSAISFGRIFAESIGIYHTGIRVNFTNEIYFSFGPTGVLLYSIILSGIFLWINRVKSFPLRVLIFSQVVSVHILGVNTVGTAVILIIISWFIFKVKKI